MKRQRPKSKAEKVRERQNRLITFNHPDLLEELRKRKNPVDNEESEATSGETVGRKKKRSLAVEDQIDEVFKNILSGGGEDDSEDKSGSEWPEESSESFLPADEGEDESPEEFSSKLQDRSEEFQSAKTVLEKEERVRRKKLSKKKRDALKDFEQKSEKVVQKVSDGIYKVDMSGAQFEVVALESVMAGDELAQSSHVKKHVQFSFREQLLRVSTAKNRSNRFRFGADKRASVFLKKS